VAVRTEQLGRPWVAPRSRTRVRRPARSRVLALLATVLLVACTVWVRLVYWQVLQHPALATLAANQHLVELTETPTRGLIYDSSGRPLALDTTVYDVVLAADEVGPDQRQGVAQALSAVLRIPAGPVLQLLRSQRPFAYVAKRISQPQATRLEQLQLPGISLEPVQQRQYLPGGAPGTTLASDLLGFVNDAGQGQYGIEQYYNGVLAGRAGSIQAYQDSAGEEIPLTAQIRRPMVNGQSLTLTLDSQIQYAAEQALAAGVKRNRAASGSVIVLDSHTGGVVAWADYPAYNANDFAQTDPALFQDQLVSSLYEPGSVMKVVTLAGALDDGAITPDTTIYDPGWVQVDGVTLHDWTTAYAGTVTMREVLEQSLNVGAVHAEEMEGQAAYFHYLQAFGLERPSGVDVAGEATMAMPPPDRWNPVDVATASFGQGIAVNMVQMAAAVNAIANGGRWVQPHVVERIGDRTLSWPSRQVVKPTTAATMTQMMEDVVQHGSGWMARIPGFQDDEAGKTGTSQIPVNGRYTNEYWASYVGFLPAQNPRFTMLVVVREPNNGSLDLNEGYYVSAPIWKQIAEQIILDWRITPPGAGASN
jgi:cell division protein FtsI (penicillin-binding protein 3)